MSEHERIMDGLMHSRSRRSVKRSVTKLSEAEVRAELEERRVSLVGSEAMLRDRLLRALLIEVEPGNKYIPWYDWDKVGGVNEGRANVTGMAREGVQEVREEERDQAPSTESREPMVSSDERAPNIQRERADVQVHREEYDGIQAALTVTTATVTTTQASNMQPNVVAADGARTLGAFGRTVFSFSGTPRVSVTAQMRQYFEAHPEQWEYYSARLVRGNPVHMQPPPEQASTSAPANATIEPPANASIEPPDDLRTPFGNIMRDRDASSSSSEAGSSGQITDVERRRYARLQKSLGKRTKTRRVRSRIPMSRHDLERALRDEPTESALMSRPEGMMEPHVSRGMFREQSVPRSRNG